MRLKRIISFIITLIIIASALTVSAFSADKAELYINSKGGTICIANRGLRLHEPENSIAAINRAVAVGAHGVLIDVKKTADDVLVLFAHDDVSKMTDGTGAISELSYNDLSQLHLRQGEGGSQNALTDEKIPTLEQALSLNIDCLFVVNVSWELRDDVYSIAEKCNALSKVIFLMKDAKSDSLAQWKQSKTTTPMTLSYFKGNVIFAATSFVKKANEIGEGMCLATKVPYGVIFGETVTSKADHSRLCAYIADPALTGTIRQDCQKWWDDLLSRGYDMLITDYPEELVEYIGLCQAKSAKLSELYKKCVTDFTLPDFKTDKYYDYRLAYTNARDKADRLLADKSRSLSDLTTAYFELENAYLDIVNDYDSISQGTAGKTITPVRIILAIALLVGFVALELFFYKKKKKD